MNNKIVKGKVIGISKTYLEIKLKNEQIGFVHISQVSDYYIPNLETIFQKGDYHHFVVIDDQDESQVKLGWKQIHPRFLKNPFKFEICETKNGFENLKKATLREIEND